MESLVSTEWLARELGGGDLRVLDASYFLSGSGRDARAEFEAAHIPGAVFFDLKEMSAQDDPRPNMMPPPDRFAERAGALGVGEEDRIVVYDDTPLHSAARAWWMFQAMGHERVAILDGGLAKWRAEGRPVESGPARPQARRFTPRPDSGAIADKDFMRANVDAATHQVLDARPAARFAGGPPDTHGVAGGHIPGSSNLPQDRLFAPDGTWKSGAALQAEFYAAGVDLDRPMVATCGSGVTACVLLFGAHLLGRGGAKLYDGSWSEWGADPDTPKAAGEA